MRYLILTLFLFTSHSFAAGYWTTYAAYADKSACNDPNSSTSCPPHSQHPFREVETSTHICAVIGSDPVQHANYSQMICQYNSAPCEAPEVWNQETESCAIPQPPACENGSTNIGGSCEQDAYCPSLNGTISANLSCPPEGKDGCPGGTDSCGMDYGDAAQTGDSAGSQGNGQEGKDAAGNGDNKSDAQSGGGAAGAQRGLEEAMKQSAANNLNESQKNALREAASNAGGSEGATPANVSGSVIATCSGMNLPPQICGELAIAAANGYQSGSYNSANAWQQTSDGATNGSDYICTGDCSWMVLNCPTGTKWNGSSSFAQCVPDLVSQACEPSVYNSWCSESFLCNESGGVWNSIREACTAPVGVNNCPTGSTRDSVTGQCVSAIGDDKPVSCSAGYQWTGTNCAAIPTGTSQTINNDGSVTTTYNYNTTNYNTPPTDEASQGAGDCDPTAEDYQYCLGQLENVDDSHADDLNNQKNAESEGVLEDFENQMTDFIENGNELGYEPNFFESIWSGIIPQPTGCSAVSFSTAGQAFNIDCSKFDKFKVWFGWFLYLMTFYYLFTLALSPVRSEV